MNMKTIRTGKIDKLDLRLIEKNGSFTGIIFTQDSVEKARIIGDVADDVWCRLQDEARIVNPKYVGFGGARTRFLRFFPNGFQSEGFVSEERKYKVDAKAKLDLTAPLAEAVNGSGFGEAVLSVFRATNLLSPFEKTRLQEVLRGGTADVFIRAAARFAMGENAALLDLERILEPYDCSKWTVVTYLPFLWCPEKHMYLKPEVTKDFGTRVGHRFASDYEPRLNIGVYACLLDLAAKTANELAELQPRDRIDVQSFIWVVGAYNEETEASTP